MYPNYNMVGNPINMYPNQNYLYESENIQTQDRFFPGGFLAPLLLGGIAGYAIAERPNQYPYPYPYNYYYNNFYYPPYNGFYPY